MAGPRRLNVVSLTIYLALAFAGYLSVQYAPYYWKKMELENLVKDESYGANRHKRELVVRAIVKRAQKELDISLDPEEDVIVHRRSDRVNIRVYWHYSVDHPFGKVTYHLFQIRQETVFY